MSSETDVLFSQQDGVLSIMLNRPKALNALSHYMDQAIRDQYVAAAKDDSVTEILTFGAGTRGLCAGGDVKKMVQMGLDALAEGKIGQEIKDYARDYTYFEYQMNGVMYDFPKHQTAIMNGFTMGGGLGYAMACDMRIVSDDTRLAMPETAIGFIPDVGACAFLPKLPHNIGLFMALTGSQITGADALWLGLGTHYVPEDCLEALIAGTQEHGIQATLPLYEEPADKLGEAPLKAQAEVIEACFGKGSPTEIMAALATAGDFAAQTLATMNKRSPGSIQLAFDMYHYAKEKGMGIKEALQLEYQVCQFLKDLDKQPLSDFYEGVRAVLIDKDHNAKWAHASVAEVPSDWFAQAMAHPAPTIEFLEL